MCAEQCDVAKHKQTPNTLGSRQYTLGALLLVITVFSVFLSVWRVIGGGVGPIELAIVGLAVPWILMGILLRLRRVLAVIFCLFAGAVLSPPDPISMLLVAVPLSCAYLIGVWLYARRKNVVTAAVDSETQQEHE